MTADSPDLVVAKRLLVAAQESGLRFQRVASNPEPTRTWGAGTVAWRDSIYLAIYLAGFS